MNIVEKVAFALKHAETVIAENARLKQELEETRGERDCFQAGLASIEEQVDAFLPQEAEEKVVDGRAKK